MAACSAILVVLALLKYLSPLELAVSFGKSAQKAQTACDHYRNWIEQMPEDYWLKNTGVLEVLYDGQNCLAQTGGLMMEQQEELIKYELGKLDVTGTGALERYLTKIFDESKPEYLLIDAETREEIDEIQLKVGELKTIQFYRNGEEILVNEKPSGMIWGKEGEFAQLLSMGVAKAYVQDPEVAGIVNNEITARAKGKTKLILFYSTFWFEVDLKVTE